MTAPKINDRVALRHQDGEMRGQVVGFTSDAAGVFIEVFVYREEFE